MQINVLASINNPPVVEKPLETCIATGEKYSSRIQATDPDGDRIEVELYGGFVEKGGSIENIFPLSSSLKLIDLKWTPTCSAISERPVQGIIRVVDYHPSSLSAVEEWEVQVIGAAINGLNVVADDKHFNLSWNPYLCARDKAIIEIYRTECDTSNIKRAKCTSGVPSAWGFTKIGEVSSTSTSFVDDGSVLGISSGVTYYYILSVKFPTPSNGGSYASKVVSASLSNDSPFITEASYDKTLADKKINLSWYHFTEVDDSKYTKPFTYTLYNGTALVDNYTFNGAENLSLALDTNSLDLTKSFLLELYDANKNKIGSQSLAYVEQLKAFGTDQAMNVTWTNRNPWFYNDTLWQKIYAFKADEDTVLIDSVRGGNTMFTIPNLKNGDSVCAYVEVAYTYCIDGLDSVFYAYTNTSCALIKDNVKPCPPVLSIKNIDCEEELVANELSWINQLSAACSDDILTYQLFKQEQVAQGDFEFLKETTNEFLSFDDVEGQELNCYYITAKDSSGNESAASNIVCQDFCGELILPNIFTPNNDGKNDIFSTKTNFSGFSNPVFLVYNRWGKEVYRDSDFKHLEWDGIASNGAKLSDGTYYIYISAQRLTGAQDLLEYKGWLQIMR
jgi:gliding motility-associated-like protein